MTNLELMKALGGIREESLIGAEALQRNSAVCPARGKRPLLVAAIIIMTLLLAGCAAAYVLHLESLKIGDYRYTPAAYIDENGDVIHETETDREVLSLQGVAGSPAFEAAQEWHAFEQGYDQDHSLLDEADKNPIAVSEEYDAYFVYTQEMVDKVDEIAAKYGLKLAGEQACTEERETDIFFDTLGISQLHRPGGTVSYGFGYFYACGNFSIEFHAIPGEGSCAVLGSYRYNRKDCFDTVFAYINNIEDCEEWTYKQPNGQTVLIAMDELHAYVFCDRENEFVSLSLNRVNWNEAGEQETLTKQEVTQIVNQFDFTVVPQKPDMAMAKCRLEASWEAYQKQQEAGRETAVPDFPDYQSYDDVIRFLLGGVNPQDYCYALRDITEDGDTELFLGMNDNIGSIQAMQDGKVVTLFDQGTGEGFYMCEGNIIKQRGTQGNYESYVFWEPNPSTGKYQSLISMGYDPEKESWYYSKGFGAFQFVTKEEFDEMVNSYRVVDIEMKPISEYPFS